MISFIFWFILVIVLGWAALPILFMLFPNLSDRGYAFIKPAGLLLFGYLYWILVTFQILPNTWTGIASVYLAVVLSGGLIAWKTGFIKLKKWVIHNKWYILFTESGFLLLFSFFAIMRAAYPDIIGTEKPMELAFINSILRSEFFPPADPWLSGYAISYYYFGYVMVAGLIRLTFTLSGVGFNLAISLWFAMACLGAFGLAYNILSVISNPGDKPETKNRPGFGWALFAPLFLVFTANWEGLFESLHARGLFWDANGQSAFWKWLDIEELTVPPATPLTWLANRPAGIWWWRASRVIQDYDLAGKSGGVIDEFPFFSLYLADLHPHILSMPFVLLACAVALEFYFKARSGNQYRIGWYSILRNWFTGETNQTITGSEILMSGPVFWSSALLFGGLAFLNMWDFPIYVGLSSAAIVLGRYLSRGWSRKRIVEFFETGLGFGVVGAILYLPFYAGFASQAGGLLPSLAFFTRGTHLWLMFGVFLVPIFAGILSIVGMENIGKLFRYAFKNSLIIVAVLWISMSVLGLAFAIIPGLLARVNPVMGATLSSAANQFFSIQGSGFLRDILVNTSLLRIMSPGGWVTLVFLLTLVWGGLIWLRDKYRENTLDILPDESQGSTSRTINSLPFVFLLLAGGVALVLFPEFFYLRDQFGTRMNTIFKFYYQAWILWSVAAAIFVYFLWLKTQSWKKWTVRLVFVLSLTAGLMYPFFGFYYRFDNLFTRDLTIDGNSYFYAAYPDETAAIAFLQLAPKGTIAEAIGGSYTGYARVSTQTGMPTVLGWPGHESQWRGGAQEIGSREPDIKLLYQTNNWSEALSIIQKYQIRYVYIGMLEQSTYNVNEAKFKNNLRTVFENNSVIIYEVPSQLLTAITVN